MKIKYWRTVHRRYPIPLSQKSCEFSLVHHHKQGVQFQPPQNRQNPAISAAFPHFVPGKDAAGVMCLNNRAIASFPHPPRISKTHWRSLFCLLRSGFIVAILRAESGSAKAPPSHTYHLTHNYKSSKFELTCAAMPPLIVAPRKGHSPMSPPRRAFFCALNIN